MHIRTSLYRCKGFCLVLFFINLVSMMAVKAQPPAPAQAPAQSQMPPSIPLHTLRPDYPMPYDPTTVEKITEVLVRIHGYLDKSSPSRMINRQDKTEITDFSKLDNNSMMERGAFGLVSYEWGVTYSGMLLAGEVTGDARFTEYTTRRMKFIAGLADHYRPLVKSNPQARTPIRSVLSPQALDDAGSMCAAMIKTSRAGMQTDLRPMIENYIAYISKGQQRFEDGTLARNRPQPNTLWLDDLYMSVPALAQMGKWTGDRRYYDDAVKQIIRFSERMFDKTHNLYLHGWVTGMQPHPAFFWGRANGWAVLAMAELLDVLPEDHPGRDTVLQQFRQHVQGIASRQSGVGLWHQLLDRNDTYLETSATAIFTHCIAKAINRGWLDPIAYGPVAMLGWNAVTTKVNAQGQVEGVCVGTGMAFDPAFYVHRPVNVFAAHGYGPVLLAGAEMIRLLGNYKVQINDSAVQFYPKGK